ncbi:hypothetical protein SAMN03097699_0595 [Flavobacteriaceae bacterium MAR_2010_188]|nr:hypothetical protein SAMN03097699_0595 [Flavobacteriaceae bacterium MAR_2010_188]
MAVSIDVLFNEFKLNYVGAFKWNVSLNAKFNGVYVIALTDNPKSSEVHSHSFEICDETFNYWVTQATNLEIKGKMVTSKKEVKDYLRQFWNPNENILYIGESSSLTNPLQKRIKQYYAHKVGQKGPHTGGYWLKLLSCLKSVSVYYAESPNPREVEFKTLIKFIELSVGKSFYEIENFTNHLPFANVKIDISKNHQLKNTLTITREIRRIEKRFKI